MVTEDKIKRDYDYLMTDFQKKELSILYKKAINVIDFYMDDEDNDLVLYVTNNDTVIENYIICDEEDVYLSRIGKLNSDLDKLEKINN